MLKIRQGQVLSTDETDRPVLNTWNNLSIDTYDRMTVLFTELEKLRSQKVSVKIKKLFPQNETAK